MRHISPYAGLVSFFLCRSHVEVHLYLPHCRLGSGEGGWGGGAGRAASHSGCLCLSTTREMIDLSSTCWCAGPIAGPAVQSEPVVGESAGSRTGLNWSDIVFASKLGQGASGVVHKGRFAPSILFLCIELLSEASQEHKGVSQFNKWWGCGGGGGGRQGWVPWAPICGSVGAEDWGPERKEGERVQASNCRCALPGKVLTPFAIMRAQVEGCRRGCEDPSPSKSTYAAPESHFLSRCRFNTSVCAPSGDSLT
jgi:hypothetical protein